MATVLTSIPIASSPESQLVLIQTQQEVFLKGKIKIRLLSGSVTCLGAQLNPNLDDDDDEFQVFSPRGYSLLGLKADCQPRTAKAELRKHLKKMGLQGEQVSQVVEMAQSSAVAVWSRHSSDLDRIKRMAMFGRDEYLPGKLTLPSVYPELESMLDINLFVGESVPELRYFRTVPMWDQMVAGLLKIYEEKESVRVMVMGGKGVGKSTLIKYLCNRLLPSSGSIVFVDLDPGQAEFTPAGCLSVSRLTGPVLGPNFCNLDREKVNSVFVGDANASNVRVGYLNAVNRLASSTMDCLAKSSDNSVPVVVINTMGFNRGLGLQLLSAAASAFSPTHVVSIASAHPSKNYPAEFVSGLAANSHLLHLPAIPETTQSAMGAGDLWGPPNPRTLRDLVISAYFAGQRINVKVCWTDIFLECLCSDLPVSQVLRALNQSLVALCRLKNEPSSPYRELSNGIKLLSRPGVCDSEFLGLAIVRHVNVTEKELLLTTTMSLEEVKQSNCISMGAIELPDSLRHRTGKQVLLERETEKLRLQNGRNVLAETWQKSGRPKANFN